MAVFGSPTGRTYCLGRINVVTPGTPVPLSANVPITNAFGTPTGGIPGLTTSGNPATMRCNQIIFKAPGSGTGGNVANVGTVYLCYKGGDRTQQNSIIMDFTAGQSFVLGSSDGGSPYDPSMYVIDADNAGDGLRVTTIQAT